jgi:hypothetical protein
MSADPVAPTILQSRARVPDHVVYRQFAEETVVLNLKTGSYHGLNVTGGRMIEVLAASRTVAAAAQTLAADYRMPLEDIEHDLSVFCRALAERELLHLTPIA